MTKKKGLNDRNKIALIVLLESMKEDLGEERISVEFECRGCVFDEPVVHVDVQFACNKLIEILDSKRTDK